MTTCVAKKFARYLRNTRAVSALEYAILVGVVAVAIAAALVTLGTDLTAGMEAIGDKISDLQPGNSTSNTQGGTI